MQKITTLLLALALAPVSFAAMASPLEIEKAGDYAKLSPFTEVRANGEHYEVRFKGNMYRLVEINGFSSASIRAHCDLNYGSRSEKRFAEDLIQVLSEMGQTNPTTADLVLADLTTGKRSQHSQVPMTNVNRQSVWNVRNGRPGITNASAPLVTRKHAATPAPAFAHLAVPLTWDQWQAAPGLTRNQAEADLDQLEYQIQTSYSYRDLLGVDYQAALDAVRSGLTEDTKVPAFTTRVAQILALFGDGHSRVRGFSSTRPSGFLSMLVADSANGPVAFTEDRSRYIAETHPYLVAIDGKPLDLWLERASQTVADGSPHFVRRQALRGLRSLNALRVEAGLETKNEFTVTFANAAGETITGDGTLIDNKPIYAEWPRLNDPRTEAEYRTLENNIGYLRITGMDDGPGFIQTLTDAMTSFEGTSAMIIDVRGNGGGTRDATHTLLPYFLDPAQGPHVINIAAGRVPDPSQNTPNLLANRGLYPQDWSGWNAQERQAIEQAAKRFVPDWTPNPKQFSPWHYSLISPHEKAHYTKPLIILMNPGCFSATDIFLGAFAGLPNVTLMGTPSGGGSGRSQSHGLDNSGIRYKLSTMASFRPNGQRYDGKGIAPDVTAAPDPEDFLSSGSDSVLAAAIKRLK